jgi:preprotein translocase subunit SecF
MSWMGKLYRGEHHIDFPSIWKKAIIGSAVLVLISIGSLFARGLNLGIEFEGGTSWEVNAPDASVADARDALRGTSAANAKIQVVAGETLRVRSGVESPAEVEPVTTALADLAGTTVGDVSVTTVGPSWGDEITDKAARALVWFFILVAAYIAIRLEWKMAVAALVATVHDIVISVGLYSVFQFEVTPATVIAFLTIMGYSLYDTIIVFDKVREVAGRVGTTGRYTYTEMMNLALNQVLMRSINTLVTSVLPVVSMLVIGTFFLGALTLQEFAIALAIGIVVGGYSSIFVASSLVVWMKEREDGYQAVARRIAARTDGTDSTRVVTPEDAARGPVPPVRTVRRTGPTGAPPRPRKKRKKR